MDNGTLFAEGSDIWSSGQPPIPAHKPPRPSPRLVVTPTGEMALTHEPAPAKRMPTWLDRVNAFGDAIEPRNVMRGVLGREAFDRLPTVPRNLGELFGVAATGLEWGTAAGDMVDLYNGGQMFARGVRELDPWQMIGGASTEVAATLGMLVPGRPGQVTHAYFAPSDERGVAALVTPGLPAARARKAFAEEYGHRVEDLDPAMPGLSFRERELGPIVKPRLRRIGAFWDDSYLLLNRRRQGDPENLRDYEKAVRQGIAEVDFQLRQPVSGIDWWERDKAVAFGIASHRDPIFERGMAWNGEWIPADDVQALALAIATPLSYGQRPDRNFRLALELTQDLAHTGRIPVRQPNGRNWTQKPAATQHLQLLDQMYQRMGPRRLVEFLLDEHRVDSLNYIRDTSGLFVPGSGKGVSGPADKIVLGVEMFGPKAGDFYASLNGLDRDVWDRWRVRGYNRYFGRETYPGAPDHAGVFDVPRNGREGEIMRRYTRDVADAHRLGVRETEAVMWHFEQNLHNDMGQKDAKPQSLVKGAQDFVAAGYAVE